MISVNHYGMGIVVRDSRISRYKLEGFNRVESMGNELHPLTVVQLKPDLIPNSS
jgi:hypothetical protein